MATKIRLARGGAKKHPYYRIVVADSRACRDGKFIEKIGTYNPLVAKGAEGRLKIQKDRIEHWLKTGAVPTERVALFLAEAGIGKDNSNIKDILKKRDKSIKVRAGNRKRAADAEAAKVAAEAAAEAEKVAAAEKAAAEKAAAAAAAEAPAA